MKVITKFLHTIIGMSIHIFFCLICIIISPLVLLWIAFERSVIGIWPEDIIDDFKETLLSPYQFIKKIWKS